MPDSRRASSELPTASPSARGAQITCVGDARTPVPEAVLSRGGDNA